MDDGRGGSEPCEWVLPDAVAHRVYVAMATLREQRGLEAVIAGADDGDRIASELDVLVFREAAPCSLTLRRGRPRRGPWGRCGG